jgi:predicted RNase H-like nuclease (RuvC/YqgF family)
MCRENKRGLIILLIVFLCCSLLGVVHPEEQWYLILEGELQSIERYKSTREAERQTWLSQVNALKVESVNLNRQLSEQREVNKQLTRSFNEYEIGQLTLLSSKNGQIAGLNQQMMEKQVAIERYKRKSAILLVIIAVLGFGIGGYVVFRHWKAATLLG